MYELHLKGFKNKRQVEAFIDWYGEQGEQDAGYFFSAMAYNGELDTDFMAVDMSKEHKWDGTNLVAYIKVYKLEE